MDRVDALTTAQEALAAIGEIYDELGNVVQQLGHAANPFDEADHWLALTLRLRVEVSRMEAALDIVISEMETVASWRIEDGLR
jgi:hypothetical protein